MSTMLSDKVEQVGGAVGAAGGLAGSETGAGGRPAVADFRDELRRWKADVLSAIEGRLSAADAGRGQSSSAGEYQTREALAGVQQAVQSDARELAHRVEDYVIEHPLKAVAIAVGAGFLLGVLWSH